MIPSFYGGAVIEVFDPTPTGVQAVEVEHLPEFGSEGVGNVSLADVDNDGLNEVACMIVWAAGSALLFYKYQNGRYEVLRDAHSIADSNLHPFFPDAQVSDFDGDGQFEVVSEPFGGIPEDLLPPGHTPDVPGVADWGRVRYVWRWNQTLNHFELLERKFLYIGGR